MRRGSPRARALNGGGVGTNWRFSTNKPPYLRNGKRYDKGYITNRKLNRRFRLVPKSTTLVDAEIALVCIELSSFSSLFDGCDLHRHHIKST